jgi:hypothetical protein
VLTSGPMTQRPFQFRRFHETVELHLRPSSEPKASNRSDQFF